MDRRSPVKRARRQHPTLGVAAALVGFIVVPSTLAARGAPPGLDFEKRVAAQRDIEQVYWDHRTWPKENRSPKPPLSGVLSEAAIRARVRDYLEKSETLARYWRRPITPEQLQAEMERMARGTRAPQVLQELFAALGNDPRVIAETLVRQTLADRLVRNWYAHDARVHGGLRKRAEADLAGCRNARCLRSLSGEYHETTWKFESEETQALAGNPDRDVVFLGADEWNALLERLPGTLRSGSGAVPAPRVSALEETAEAFVVTAVIESSGRELRTASLTWRKVPFDE